MQHRTLRERLRSLDRGLGGTRLGLLLGRRRIDLEGLDARLAAALTRRWGGFVVQRPEGPAVARVCFYRGGPGTWLERWEPGEIYRLEALGEASRRLVASYHFGMEHGDTPSSWRVGISDEPEEPLPRIVENVVRFLAAGLALDDGGFALHAAGVLREGRAFLLAGPSRAGKTTASSLVAGAQSLGDDFGMIVRDGSTWQSPALPFDNTERVIDRPTSGLYPVAGVWRLHQAQETRVERPAPVVANAALLGCAAFAWAMPERVDELIDHVRRFVEQGLFRQLHFARGTDLWPHLEGTTAPDC